MNKMTTGFGALLLMITGCATSRHAQPTRTVAASEPTVCKTQHDGKTINGDDVTVCDQLFNASPFVTPPADDISNPNVATFYGAISEGGGVGQGIQMIDRNGVNYNVVGTSGKAITDLSKLPANLKMPENTIFYTIYKVVGKIKNGKAPSLSITSIAPAIQLTGCAIDSALLGTWEGSTSTRTAAGANFDTTKDIPMTVVFDHLKVERNLSVYADQSKTLPDAQVFGIVGLIQNMRSLPTDPFMGSSNGATIELYRITGMHSPGDSHIAVIYPLGTEGMGPGVAGSLGMSFQNVFGMFSPAALLQAHTPDLAMTGLQLQPHSSSHPPNLTFIKLHPTQIGAQSGQCSEAVK